jgi:hypothetical protein
VLLNLLVFSIACTKTVVIKEPIPCNISPIPLAPELNWTVCDNTDYWLCLDEPDSRELTAWLLELQQWQEDYDTLCTKEN